MRSSIVLLLLVFVSCRKGELPEAYYFSKIQVQNLSFPNSPDVDVRFNGKSLGNILSGRNGTFDLNTAKGKLELYKANTDSLLADTLITLEKNVQNNFRFAYYKDLDLVGFLGNSAAISADTIAFQILNNLGNYYKTYTDLDLHIFFYNYETGTLDETGYVIEHFQNVKLSATTYKLDFATNDGTPNVYVCRLVDKATGEYILMPASGMDFFLLPQEAGGGSSFIYSMADDAGEVTVTSIPL